MNGKVSFTRRVNLGNYEHKEASAEISFQTDDEHDYLAQKQIIDLAADLSVEVVEVRLGLRELKIKVSTKPAAQRDLSDIVDTNLIPPWMVLTDATGTPCVSHGQTAPTMADPLAAADDFINSKIDADGDPLEDALANRLPDPVAVAIVAEASPEQFGSLANLDAELAAMPRLVSNDEAQSAARDFVMKHGQPGKLAVQKLLSGYALQIAAIPQERRLSFLAELAATVV